MPDWQHRQERERWVWCARSCGALVLAAWTRTLSKEMLQDALLSTMRTTGVIMLIVSAAIYLTSDSLQSV